MSNFGTIRGYIRANLADNGASQYYTDTDINNSIQEAYNEIVAKSKCNIKKVTKDWPSTPTNYLDFLNDFAVTDYIGTIAIFNNNTNMWLRDDVSLRDFDRIRRDWEVWVGEPQFWAPHSPQYVAISPKQPSASGNFNLFYWAQAPVWFDGSTSPNDTDTPIIASDMHMLFEQYCTGDLLESADEISKSQSFWGQYKKNLASYKKRCDALCRADLLMRL